MKTTGFFVLAGCVIKCIYQRRMEQQLQLEVTNLLYEYIPQEGFDMEQEMKETTDDPAAQRKTSLLNAQYV